MVDLVKISKVLKEEARFAARLKAKAASRAKVRPVRADYALPAPVADATPYQRIEAPALPLPFTYVGKPTEDDLVWRRRRDADKEVRSYVHSVADWEQTRFPHPEDPHLGTRVNAGRVSEITAPRAGAPSRVIPPSKRVRVRAPIAPAMARGADMLITDRPVAKARPVFTRRPRSAYALLRSLTYIDTLRALRDALTTGREEAWIRACRRHRDEALMALGDRAKHIEYLSERLK